MAFYTDENGNITLIQGDSGSLLVTGLNTDENYNVYLGIQDEKRNPIGNEIVVNSNNSPSVVFELTGDYTDLLNVPKNKSYATYYYGIKVCLNGNFEDTLIIGNGDIGSMNTITVFPKKVEGTTT